MSRRGLSRGARAGWSGTRASHHGPGAHAARVRVTARTLWLGAVGFLVCGLMVTACGGGGPETPEGFTRVTVNEVSFAYPEGWTKVPEGTFPEGWPAGFQDESGGRVSAWVGVYVKLSKTSDPALAASQAMLGLEHSVKGLKRQGGRKLEIDGAESAWRSDYTYPGNPQQGLSGKTIQGTDIVAVGGSGQPLLVRITRVQGELPEQTTSDIIGSISVGSG